MVDLQGHVSRYKVGGIHWDFHGSEAAPAAVQNVEESFRT